MTKNLKTLSAILFCTAIVIIAAAAGTMDAYAMEAPVTRTTVTNAVDDNGFESSLPMARVMLDAGSETMSMDLRAVMPSIMFRDENASSVTTLALARKLAAAQRIAMANGFSLLVYGINNHAVSAELVGISTVETKTDTEGRSVTVPETVIKYQAPSAVGTKTAATSEMTVVMAGIMSEAGLSGQAGSWWLFYDAALLA